ncbi:cell envelope integrity protein TolA [Rhodoferax sp.]|uniref:cell envelope integrity protein TolA n=1 Tax=Rhodoferax sp. TaxID=50421 RepID=UPI001EBCFA89|nr:cell envelope integrity protein TolA [Rhodoferax sp.]MBT9507131.1 cell envelope integrity protein TolA [Rhodoferax sp.]
MHAATDRLEFAPPPIPGMLRALGLAILAHAFLLAALTWGVSWKRETLTLGAEAELWSAVPQQAAPKLIEAPPEPQETREKPVAASPALPPLLPTVPDADIALEREKLRLKKEKQQELENQRLAKTRLEKQKQERLLQEKKTAEEKKKAAQDNKRKEALQAQQDAKKLEAQRQENIKRMTGLAGATGAATSTGTALKSSGPSTSYAGRIRARIKPNIVFADDITGNPTAEVEVRTAPDGTIVGRKLLKPSGLKAWDDAVLKAVDKTEVLPRDTDGRVPPTLVISFRPKD